ncbi:hypothetical protein D3C87_1576930 [compost metagenome]
MAQLCGAFLDLLFKRFEGVLQSQLALTQIDQPIPGFVLSSPPAQRGRHQADQGHGMKRPFKKGDIAQLRTESRRGVLFRTAMIGQQHNRQVRPGRLLLDQAEQRFKITAQQRLRRDQQQACASRQLAAKAPQIACDDAVVTRFIEHHQGNLAVASQRRENDRALGHCFQDRHGLSSPSNGLLAPI